MTTVLPPQILSGPFTVDEAAALGISRKVLDGSRFVRLFPRVFAVATLVLTHLDLVRAAQLSLGPHAAASHESGLAVWGVDIGTRGSVHLTTHHRSPTRVGGITMHRSFELGRVWWHAGCRVLSPERCLVDAATRRTLADLVTAGDWLIRLGHMTVDSFTEFVHEHHFDGIVKARRVAELLVATAESPRESCVRMMLVLAGLPAPTCNASYGDADGFVARLDMSYPRWKVAVEYDGMQHGIDLAQRERDVKRRETMERLGWIFIVVTAAQVRNPRDIVARVHSALVCRGYTGAPPELGREWRQSFDRA